MCDTHAAQLVAYCRLLEQASGTPTHCHAAAAIQPCCLLSPQELLDERHHLNQFASISTLCWLTEAPSTAYCCVELVGSLYPKWWVDSHQKHVKSLKRNCEILCARIHSCM